MKKLFGGALLITVAPILVKACAIGPTWVGFYRCVVAAILQWGLLAAIPSWRPEPRLMRDKRVWAASAGAGLFFALDLFVWHRSIVYTGAGLGTILGNTQVFYVAAIGILLYGEAATPRLLFGVPTAFLGVYLLALHGASAARGDNYLLGVACGLATGVMYACFLVFLRKAEKALGKRGVLWNIAGMSAWASVFLLAIGLMEGPVVVPRGWDILWLFLLGVVPQTAGWFLITWGLAETPLSKTGLVLLIQPLAATVLGALIFGERLLPLQLFGAGLTLFGIYLGTTRRLGNGVRHS